MQLSQIYFSDNNSIPPPHLAGCIATTQSLLPHLPHVLYDLPMARAFLSSEFGAEVLQAFDKLNPYAYKADLLRYCLLYAKGGWYFDIAVPPITALQVTEEVETIAFKDAPVISQTTWSCANTVLFAKPQSPVYARAIDLVLENCRKEHYGINPLCPTGPVLLGRAFAIEGEHPHRVFGDLIALTPSHPNRNPAFVLPDGTILAFGKAAGGGDLTRLGGTGTNNYNDFYHARTVYKPAA